VVAEAADVAEAAVEAAKDYQRTKRGILKAYPK